MSVQRNLAARQFNELLNSNKQLNNLYTHAKNIFALNEKLQKHLSASLCSHCTITNYTDKTLTINADSSAWASKLQYSIPGILDYAKHECGLDKLQTIRIKVSPSLNKTTQSNPRGTRLTRRASLSKDSAVFIENIAASIQDPALRKSILKISKNAK